MYITTDDTNLKGDISYANGGCFHRKDQQLYVTTSQISSSTSIVFKVIENQMKSMMDGKTKNKIRIIGEWEMLKSHIKVDNYSLIEFIFV